MSLEPISPRESLELYLEECRGEQSPNSIKARRYQLQYFVEWCEGADADSARVSNLSEISGLDFHKFKNWRKDGLAKTTLRTNLSALRQFMKFCVRIDAVPSTIPEKIGVPVLEQGENERDEFIVADRAETILDYYGKFQYASFDHVLFLLQWQSGMRMSGLHSLDDVNLSDEQIEVRHRPDEGTRLKNGPDGERIVTFPTSTIEVVADYVDSTRIDVEDEYGRRPLFSSENGRMSKSQLNRHVYAITTPCQHGQGCPADKDPVECEYTGSYNSLLECPHNVRPHDVRRGAITHWLKRDIPEKVVSDRMNVSVNTLDRHYDKRSENEKANQRRQFLDDL